MKQRRPFAASKTEPTPRNRTPAPHHQPDMNWFFHRDATTAVLIMLVVLLCPMGAMAGRAVAPAIHNSTLVYKTVQVYEGTPLGTITTTTYTLGERKRVPPSRPHEGYTTSTTISTRAELQVAALNVLIADAVYDKRADDPAELCITKASGGYLVVQR
jgi:hypothetical protein